MGVRERFCSDDIFYLVWSGLVIGTALIIVGVAGLRRS